MEGFHKNMEKIINLHDMTQYDIKRKIRESKDTREIERWICINSSIKGLSPPMIADILSRDEKTIREWITNFNEEGIAGIERVSPPGKKKRINEQQIKELKLDLEKAPTEHGIEKGYWTTPLINELIEKKTGIKYSKSRICELMKEWDFAIKRPRMKSNLADEKKQKEFIELVFPKRVEEALEKAKLMGLKLLILFTDEAGIRRDGTIHYGWYKKGSIPVIPESNGRFESVKLLGAVGALDGRIHINTVVGKITTEVYANFLIGLSGRYKEYLILIVQDNAPWHGKKKLPVLFKDAGIKNIELCNFPKYSPDMNPCEKLWKWLRETVTHCRYYADLKGLKQSIWRFYKRAYNQKDLAIKRFKTEKNIFECVKTCGKDFEKLGMDYAMA